MTLTSKPLAALVVAILFGAIFFSSTMGWWQTESTKQAAVYESGEFAGQANPADIRGSYTFGDVEKNFALPAAILAKAFGVNEGAPAAFQVKSLEEMYAGSAQEVVTSSVRLFVAFYLDLPYDLSTDTYLPETAAALLRTRSLSTEQAAYLEAHTVRMVGEAPDLPLAATAPLPAATPEATHQPEDSIERVVKGKTTFSELIDWGVALSAIEQATGLPAPEAMGMTVKDFCTQNRLDFETVKPALQVAVDAIQ